MALHFRQLGFPSEGLLVECPSAAVGVQASGNGGKGLWVKKGFGPRKGSHGPRVRAPTFLKGILSVGLCFVGAHMIVVPLATV